MANNHLDNVHTDCFTPKEPEVDLLDIAKHENVLICLTPRKGLHFIMCKILEDASNQGETSLVVCHDEIAATKQAACLRRLTCCPVNDENRRQFIYVISYATAEVFQFSFKIDFAVFDSVQNKNVAVIANLIEIIRPKRVLALADSCFSLIKDICQVETKLRLIEDGLGVRAETSSDVTTVLKFGIRPRELVIAYQNAPSDWEISRVVRAEVLAALDFLDKHRYDPMEVYGIEAEDIPDPVLEPKGFLLEFLQLLDELGPYAGDKVALEILSKIEKAKVKTPYERHYLLLSMVSTVLVKVRSLFENYFTDINLYEKLYEFCAPKILRLFECLAMFHKLSNDPLCGLIFLESRIVVKVLYYLINDLITAAPDFSFLRVMFCLELQCTDSAKQIEKEHRKQEFVLKNFRLKECNLLIGTRFLEEGIELPRCNFVVNFDFPNDFRSYTLSKGRARGFHPVFCLFVSQTNQDIAVNTLARYYETERILLDKCNRLEPAERQFSLADAFTLLVKPFCPLQSYEAPFVDLSNAIAVVNKYCAKLPSDTFTKLTPTSRIMELDNLYSCSIRLPINSPLRCPVVGLPMPSEVLARRIAAFQLCLALHRTYELDDHLLPISKEDFWAIEEQQLYNAIEEEVQNGAEPRPGTTKRRQFYHKKIAQCLTNCRPAPSTPCFLYFIAMRLTCPIPEEQNIRDRKIQPPEDSPQGFGILSMKPIATVGAFPIFTRAGEVEITFVLQPDMVYLHQEQIEKIVAFINYTFTNVLRLQKYLMMFDPASAENSYFIVPVKSIENRMIVDWKFVDLIYRKRDQVPRFVIDEERTAFGFDVKNYTDAVVSPWYRNQDQPQYFYVGEICHHLTPKSAFPGADYNTFEDYYKLKYGIQIQKTDQKLLDVDHTSARLNFLTPRYVNRKGVALPTKSDEKKKARRENLGQKQILVPELCDVHPFPASLWQKAVCLPCILHRLNALLLADELRCLVAKEINLGSLHLPPQFDWEPLNFGWNLTNVKKELFKPKKVAKVMKPEPKPPPIPPQQQEQQQPPPEGWLEVGTWSNDLADQLNHHNHHQRDEDDSDDPGLEFNLPNNVTLLDKNSQSDLDWNNKDNDFIRYDSPTNFVNAVSLSDSEYWDLETDFDSDDSEDDDEDDERWDKGGLKIEFTMKDEAEAVEDQRNLAILEALENFEAQVEPWLWDTEASSDIYSQRKKEFEKQVELQEQVIKRDRLCLVGESIESKISTVQKEVEKIDNFHVDNVFGTKNNFLPEINPNFKDNSTYVDLIKQSVAKQAMLFDIKKPQENYCINGVTDAVNKGEPPPPFEYNHELTFSFDEQPNLKGHPGPSTSLILQALTMSNANDGINLERLETIGDSFLKYAITVYLYCKYEKVHEGKLSHLRSKQVSNLNLYRLGKDKALGESMVATKFEPHDNWLPPCYFVPRDLERALIEVGLPANHWNRADLPSLHKLTREEIIALVRERNESLKEDHHQLFVPKPVDNFIPYNLMTQHSIPDKSIADCVEALIGAYLVACGPRGALLFMSWLGINVLPRQTIVSDAKEKLLENPQVGDTEPVFANGTWTKIRFGSLQQPKPPLLRHVVDPEGELNRLLTGFEEFEETLLYRFQDRSYLLQAVSHASYSENCLTDCYQRLEFLGDAVLDYLITRHLYEDARHHSPGELTDLRSALVNNTIFAALAVRYGFHRFFRHLCPALHEVLDRFVRIQQETDYAIQEDCYLIGEEEVEEAEDVEVPKALGDIFESVAGAIFLDSGMRLDAVWRVFYRIMKKEIETYSTNVPKSPIRELLELEPETAQFGKPEKLADGKRVRVSVEIFGKGVFKGIGRNYRIAKCTAAKCALKQLKKRGCLNRK